MTERQTPAGAPRDPASSLADSAAVETADAPLRVAALTIECRDHRELARFYAAALGGHVVHQHADSTIVATTGLTLVLHADPDYTAPTWP